MINASYKILILAIVCNLLVETKSVRAWTIKVFDALRLVDKVDTETCMSRFQGYHQTFWHGMNIGGSTRTV